MRGKKRGEWRGYEEVRWRRAGEQWMDMMQMGLVEVGEYWMENDG